MVRQTFLKDRHRRPPSSPTFEIKTDTSSVPGTGVVVTSLTMNCDNKSVIHITHSSVFHERKKHNEVDRHIVCHHLVHGAFTLPFVPYSLHIVEEFLTKSHFVSSSHFLLDILLILVTATS